MTFTADVFPPVTIASARLNGREWMTSQKDRKEKSVHVHRDHAEGSSRRQL